MFLAVEFSSIRVGVIVVPAGDHCQNVVFDDDDIFTMAPWSPSTYDNETGWMSKDAGYPTVCNGGGCITYLA